METPTPFSGTKILMIDDEESNLRFVRRLLTRAGVGAFHPLNDPRAAVSTFLDVQPDLLLLDLHMPHRDGFQVIEDLQPHVPGGSFFPILVMTGDPSPDVRNRALSLGASDYLTKPFDTTEAMLRMSNLLRTRALHEALQSQNQLLEARVRERTRELDDAQVEILQRLARVSEFHDATTGEHIQRVGRLADVLAREMDLSIGEAETIGRAALLHDVGKIGIQGAVHLKAGRLTPEEFAMMSEHTKIGARLLSGSRFAVLQKAEEIALNHHERWDGSGYPRGICGEAIPLSARIVAVANVFDALTSRRQYKDAWPLADALAEIRNETGRHFDPAVVEALFSLHRAGMLRRAAFDMAVA